MKQRLRSRIGWSLFLALLTAACLIYCSAVSGPWWTIAGSAITFFAADVYFGIRVCQLINFDNAVYDCRIPLRLVEPMEPYHDPLGPFGDEYWRDVNEQFRLSTDPRRIRPAGGDLL